MVFLVIDSSRNGGIGSGKSVHRIPKGVIHIHASFNSTIMTVIDVQGRVISWLWASTCGLKGTRKGTSFAAQIVTRNAI